jgi:feruloyl esterase
MKIVQAALFAVVLAARALLPTATVSAQTSCERLSSLSLLNATVTFATRAPAGNLTLPVGGRDQVFSELPSFCRVAATSKPTADSDIGIEVWLPTSNWNGKFLVQYGDSLNYRGMALALGLGYATSSTDAGRGVALGSAMLGHPEKVADFAYRGVHEMTLKAKALIQAFYGRTPLRSYWNGCSIAGGQGLMSAHRFPGDYDGIIAGAPGSPLSHGWSASKLWLSAAILKDADSAIPPAKIPIIHEAVLRACDASDGLTDRLIGDPRRCNFNPDVLLCKGTDTQSCLTVAQVETVRKFLSPVSNPRTRTLIYPALELGSELSWAGFAAGLREPSGSPLDAFRYVFLNDPIWNWRTLDFDRDVTRADEVIKAQGANTLEPDIRAFARRGGRLLLYQGWSDSTNGPQSTINYYNNVHNLLGDTATSASVRLFMAPGMGHCLGSAGEGPNSFDDLGVLEQWVETGKAPQQIVASHSTAGKVDRTRPLCPYPQVARYRGTGSIDDAANFECKVL